MADIVCILPVQYLGHLLSGAGDQQEENIDPECTALYSGKCGGLRMRSYVRLVQLGQFSSGTWNGDNDCADFPFGNSDLMEKVAEGGGSDERTA